MRINIKILFAIVILACVVFLIKQYLYEKPSNERLWLDDFKIPSGIKVSGDIVSVQNQRDWKYDENGPISKDYISKIYDANNITRVWFLIDPFSKLEAVAHTMLIFDFDSGSSVSVSVEARREEGESYDFVTGMFNNYELIYVWASEYDPIVRRTKWHKEKVQMFPLKIDKAIAKTLFLDLAKTTEEIEANPKFYNTFVDNCTSELAESVNRVAPNKIQFGYATFLPGYSTGILYEKGIIDSQSNLTDLKEFFTINEIVNNLDQDESFSSKLRQSILKN